MTRVEAYTYFEKEFDGECDWMPDITELQFKTFIDKVYDSLEDTIEAQKIIIKDKTAIIESMAQPKTCEGCKHYIYDDDNTFNKQWSECILFYCETRSAANIDDFFCPRYEPKDQ